MATTGSTRFIAFVPPSNPAFCNRNTLRTTASGPSPPVLASGQKVPRSTTVHSHSRRQPKADRNAAARAKGREQALDYSADDSDDDLPSLEELLRVPRHQKHSHSAKTLGTETTFQALNQARVQVNRAKSGIAERQGDSLDQPMILDDDESEEASTEDNAEGGADDVEIGRTERDASLYGSLGSSELASEPTIDAFGPWHDVGEDRHTDELSTLMEPPPRSPTPLLNGDNGWTDDSMAKLEEAVELVLGEKMNSLLTSTLSCPHPLAANAPQ